VSATPTRTRCAIYLRQSLDTARDGLAVDRQEADARVLVQRRGWEAVEVLRDNDISAAGKRRRPGFERLLELVERREVTVAVAWDLTRLTRNARDTLRLLETGEAAGLTLALVRGSDIDLATPAGRLTATVLAGVARHEIEQKADRQRAAAFQRAEHGRPPLGVRLTGYTVAGQLVEAEAAVVRELFGRFAAGDSLRALAEWLTTTGLPTRRGGTRWSPSTVRTMLTNPRYAGRAVYQGEPTGRQGSWPPLVDPAVFDAAVARLADPRRKTNRYGHDRKHIGAGLYECNLCGARVYSWSGGRYRCPAGCLTRSRADVDNFVLRLVRARLGRPDLATLLPAADSEQAQRLGAEVQRLRARLLRIEEDYDAELIDGRRYKTATEKIRAQLAPAEAARARLVTAGAASMVLAAADPVAAFNAAPLMIAREVVGVVCTVRLGPAPRGRRGFDPWSLAASRWAGDNQTWGQLWEQEGHHPQQ
jgi:DNA invertase Pin-like site-specific DNA recombinase